MLQTKDKILTECLERDGNIKYLFYDKQTDSQDNIKLSILANALEIAYKLGKAQEQQQQRI